MSLSVPLQLILSVKLASANVAFKRHLSRVDHGVRFQVVLILQLLVADLTLKDPLGVGDHQVLPQKPLRSEFLVT